MSLRHQLEKILPTLLPADPDNALKGTELIRLVRLRLEGDYSDASLRFHFSTLAGDPTSPLAKVEKSQGYYHRQNTQDEVLVQSQQPLLTSLSIEFLGEEAPLEVQRRQKAQTLALLYYEQTRLTPYLLTPPPDSAEVDSWLLPELLVVDCPLVEEESHLKQDKRVLCERLMRGQALLPLHSVCLSLSASLETLRPEFFKALSATSWTHTGELLFVEPILEEALAQTLRQLGMAHGLSVASLGLSLDVLDEMPSAYEMMEASTEYGEILLDKVQYSLLVPSKTRLSSQLSPLEPVYQQAPHIKGLLESLQGGFFHLLS